MVYLKFNQDPEEALDSTWTAYTDNGKDREDGLTPLDAMTALADRLERELIRAQMEIARSS